MNPHILCEIIYKVWTSEYRRILDGSVVAVYVRSTEKQNDKISTHRRR